MKYGGVPCGVICPDEVTLIRSSHPERNLAQVERILRGLSGGEDAPEPVSREDLAARIAEGSVTVLDVRPADEFAAGHIPGALNTTLTEIERIVPTLDPAAEIVAYCRGPYCVYAHQAVAALALQLHVSSKVCLPCCGLMSPSPHRPSDNISRFNLTLGQPIGDASDLLN